MNSGLNNTTMNNNLLTRGQLERKISQEIQSFYRHNLEHTPSKVTCQFFGTKLAIILDDSITNAEQVLLEEGNQKLAVKVRSSIDNAIQPGLIELIEKIAKVTVLDIMSDATLSTGRTGIIVILDSTPIVSNPESVPKTK